MAFKVEFLTLHVCHHILFFEECPVHNCVVLPIPAQGEMSEAREETPAENDSSSDSDSDDDVQIHIGEIKTAPYLQYVVTVY